MLNQESDAKRQHKGDEVSNQRIEGMEDQMFLLQNQKKESSIQQDQNQELNRPILALEELQLVYQEKQIYYYAETLGNQEPQAAKIFNVINVEQNFEDHFQKLESLGEDSDKNEKETIIGCWLHGVLKFKHQEDKGMFEYK